MLSLRHSELIDSSVLGGPMSSRLSPGVWLTAVLCAATFSVPGGTVAQDDEPQRCVTFAGDIPDSPGGVGTAIIRGDLIIADVESPDACDRGPAAGGAQVTSATLYLADDAEDFDAWTIDDGWGVAGGLLLATGSVPLDWVFATAIAPFQPTSETFAIELAFEVLGVEPDGGSVCIVCPAVAGLGVFALKTEDSGYRIGLRLGEHPELFIAATSDREDREEDIRSRRVDPGPGPHTLCVELDAHRYRVYLDGEVRLEGTDTGALRPGSVGTWSRDVRASVSSFTVKGTQVGS
jgi:hypothetical protein